MIFHDKNGKYPIVCSFCGAEEECEHLFALFNRNRGEIEKGTIKTHFDDIKTFIQEQLITFISKKNITPKLKKVGKFERELTSWFMQNFQTILIVLMIFFIPLLIKFIKVMQK